MNSEDDLKSIAHQLNQEGHFYWFKLHPSIFHSNFPQSFFSTLLPPLIFLLFYFIFLSTTKLIFCYLSLSYTMVALRFCFFKIIRRKYNKYIISLWNIHDVSLELSNKHNLGVLLNFPWLWLHFSWQSYFLFL